MPVQMLIDIGICLCRLVVYAGELRVLTRNEAINLCGDNIETILQLLGKRQKKFIGNTQPGQQHQTGIGFNAEGSDIHLSKGQRHPKSRIYLFLK